MANKVTVNPGISSASLYGRAALTALPGIGKPAAIRGDAELPSTVFVLDGIKVSPSLLQKYCRTTGSTYGEYLPLNYLFVAQTPLMLTIMTAKDFPFSAIGAVHVENTIHRLRKIGATEPLTISAKAENLREHRKGILVDLVSEFRVGSELVATNTSTLLHQQRTSLSDGPREETPVAKRPASPNSVVAVDLSVIKEYAAASGDRNPIHMSNISAKAFGFPRAIAHGMWSAARVIANLDSKLADNVTYNVKFSRPILLPAKVNQYVEQTGDGFNLALLDRKSGAPHLRATVR